MSKGFVWYRADQARKPYLQAGDRIKLLLPNATKGEGVDGIYRGGNKLEWLNNGRVFDFCNLLSTWNGNLSWLTEVHGNITTYVNFLRLGYELAHLKYPLKLVDVDYKGAYADLPTYSVFGVYDDHCPLSVYTANLKAYDRCKVGTKLNYRPNLVDLNDVKDIPDENLLVWDRKGFVKGKALVCAKIPNKSLVSEAQEFTPSYFKCHDTVLLYLEGINLYVYLTANEFNLGMLGRHFNGSC